MDYPMLSENINKSVFIELLSMTIYNVTILESPTQPAKIPPKVPPRIPPKKPPPWASYPPKPVKLPSRIHRRGTGCLATATDCFSASDLMAQNLMAQKRG